MTSLATADTLYSVGYWLIEQERHEDAKHVFRTMLTLAPRDERGWLALGHCHELTSEAEKAEQLYGLAPMACATSARCLLALARLLRRLDRNDEAAQAYELATSRAEAAGDDQMHDLIASEAP